MAGAWTPTTEPTPEGEVLDINDNSEQGIKHKGLWYSALPQSNSTPANVITVFQWRTP